MTEPEPTVVEPGGRAVDPRTWRVVPGELDDGLTAEQADEMYEREAALDNEEPY